MYPLKITSSISGAKMMADTAIAIFNEYHRLPLGFEQFLVGFLFSALC